MRYETNKFRKRTGGMNMNVRKAIAELCRQANQAATLIQGLVYDPDNKELLDIICEKYPNFRNELRDKVDFLDQKIVEKLFSDRTFQKE